MPQLFRPRSRACELQHLHAATAEATTTRSLCPAPKEWPRQPQLEGAHAWQQRTQSKTKQTNKWGNKEKYFPLIPPWCMPPMPSPSWAPSHFLVKRLPCSLLLSTHHRSQRKWVSSMPTKGFRDLPGEGCFHLSLPRHTIYTIQRSHPESQAMYVLRVFTFWNFQMRNELFMYQHPSQLHGINVNISPVTKWRRGPNTRFQSPRKLLWSRTTSWLYLFGVKTFRSVQHLLNKRGRVRIFGHESSFPWIWPFRFIYFFLHSSICILVLQCL